jgi:hypothetical protein
MSSLDSSFPSSSWNRQLRTFSLLSPTP